MFNVALLMELWKKLDTGSLAHLANFAQHVLQSEEPNKEFQRLMSIIDQELKPKFRMTHKTDSSMQKPGS